MFDFISYEVVSHQHGFHNLKCTMQQRYMSVLKCSDDCTLHLQLLNIVHHLEL